MKHIHFEVCSTESEFERGFGEWIGKNAYSAKNAGLSLVGKLQSRNMRIKLNNMLTLVEFSGTYWSNKNKVVVDGRIGYPLGTRISFTIGSAASLFVAFISLLTAIISGVITSGITATFLIAAGSLLLLTYISRKNISSAGRLEQEISNLLKRIDGE